MDSVLESGDSSTHPAKIGVWVQAIILFPSEITGLSTKLSWTHYPMTQPDRRHLYDHAHTCTTNPILSGYREHNQTCQILQTIRNSQIRS